MEKDTVKNPMSKILNVFLENRNQTVTLEQIVRATGMPVDQARNNINNLRNKKNVRYSIDTVIQGNAWLYTDIASETSKGKRLFEEIGPTKDGSLVIQDSEGNLYKASVL